MSINRKETRHQWNFTKIKQQQQQNQKKSKTSKFIKVILYCIIYEENIKYQPTTAKN